MILAPHQAYTREEDAVRMETEALKKKEYHLIHSQRRQRGHTLFSFNTVTKAIGVVKYKRDIQLNLDGTVAYNNKVTIDKDCIYIQALNKKNCMKKLRKMGYDIK